MDPRKMIILGAVGLLVLPFGFGALIQFTKPSWITVPIVIWCLVGIIASIAVLGVGVSDWWQDRR